MTFTNQNKIKATSVQSTTKQKPLVKPSCVFDEDEELEQSDDEDKKTTSKKPSSNYQVNTASNLLKKQTQIQIEKAIKEDPSVFQYDEVIDEIEKQKAKIDPKAANNVSKEPKYIAGIMKAAAKRQMEFEKLQERKIHKERENEGDLWKDKEVFVTSAYKKKLEERKRIEEEERNQDRVDALLDVSKQKDLSGFYYSMLKIRSGEMVIEEEGEKEKRLKQEITDAKLKEKAATSQQKSYRTKNQEESDEEVDDEVENVNENKADEAGIKTEPVDQESEQPPAAKKAKSTSDAEPKPAETTDKNVKNESIDESSTIPVKKLTKEEERQLRREKLFTKRTVGEQFDIELSEYFSRKSQILSLKSYIERE